MTRQVQGVEGKGPCGKSAATHRSIDTRHLWSTKERIGCENDEGQRQSPKREGRTIKDIQAGSAGEQRCRNAGPP
jgi:hypothetical protein